MRLTNFCNTFWFEFNLGLSNKSYEKEKNICCDRIPKRIVLFVANSLFNNVYKINFRHAS